MCIWIKVNVYCDYHLFTVDAQSAPSLKFDKGVQKLCNIGKYYTNTLKTLRLGYELRKDEDKQRPLTI